MPSSGITAPPDKRPIPLSEELYVRLVAFADQRALDPGVLLERLIIKAIPVDLEVGTADAKRVGCRCCADHGRCRKPFRWRDQIRCGCGR